MKTGRSLSTVSGGFTEGSYKLATAQYFACVDDTGELIPQGTVRPNGEGGVDWSTYRAALIKIHGFGLTPAPKIWVCNIDGAFNGTPQLTEAGIINFLNRLNQIMTQEGIPEVWFTPCWEFNQPSAVNNTTNTQYDWGLGIANSPRNWAVKPSIYNNVMSLFKQHKGPKIKLMGCPDSRKEAILYPNRTPQAWMGWEGTQGGKKYLDPYLPGLKACDVFLPTFYVENTYMENQDVLENIVFDWTNKMKALVGLPFGFSEWNTTYSGTGPSPATTTFVDLSYELMHKNGYEVLIWWVGFSQSATNAEIMLKAAEYWALQQTAPPGPDPAKVGGLLIALLVALGVLKE